MEVLEPGLAFMLAFANVVAVDTADGPVIVDASSFHLADVLLVRARVRAPSPGPDPALTCAARRGEPNRARWPRCRPSRSTRAS